MLCIFNKAPIPLQLFISKEKVYLSSEFFTIVAGYCTSLSSIRVIFIILFSWILNFGNIYSSVGYSKFVLELSKYILNASLEDAPEVDEL